MFKKLQNKVAQQVTNREAFKFQFNLSIDHLTEVKEKKKDECTYAVFWKRGKKRKGETEFNKVEGTRIIWNRTFKFNGTLYFKKGKFQKKDLQLTLEEKGKNGKTNSLVKEALDLALFVDEDNEKTSTKEIDMPTKDSSKAKLKIVINSKCLKDQNPNDDDFTAVSTYTGGNDDVDEDEGTNQDIGEEKDDEHEEHDYNDHEEHNYDEEEHHEPEVEVNEEDIERDIEEQMKEEEEHPEEHHDEEPEEEDEQVEKGTEDEEENNQHSETDESAQVSSHVDTAEFERQINHLKRKVKLLLKQVKTLKENDKTNLLKKVQKEKDSAVEKLKTLQRENEDLIKQRDKAQESQQEVDSKLFELQLKQKQAQKNETEIKKLKDKIKELEEENENGRASSSKQKQSLSYEYDEKIQNLEEEIKNMREQAKEYEEQLIADKKQMDKLKRENEKLQEDMKSQKVTNEKELSESKTRYENEIEKLKKEFNTTETNRKVEIDELETDINRLKEERKGLAELVSQQSKEISSATKHRELLLSCLLEFRTLKSKIQNTLLQTATQLGNSDELSSILTHSDSFSDIVENMRNGISDDSIIKAKQTLENEVKEEISAVSEVLTSNIVQIQNANTMILEKNESLERNLQDIKKERDDLSSKISALNIQLSQSTETRTKQEESATKEKESLKKQIENLKQEYLSKDNEYSTKMSMLKSGKEALALDLKKATDEVERLKDDLKKEKNAHTEDVEKATQKWQSSEKSKTEMQDSLQKEISELKERVEDVKKQSSQHSNEVVIQIENKLSEYQEKYSKAEEKNRNLTQEVENLNQSIESYKKKLEDVSSELESSINVSKEIEKRCEEKDKEIESYKQQVEDLEEECKKLKEASKQVEELLLEEITHLKNTIGELKQEASRHFSTVLETFNDVSDIDSEARKLKSTEVDLNKLVESLREERKNLDTEITTIKSKNQQLEEKMKEKEKDLSEKILEIESLSKNSASMDDIVKKQKVTLEKKLGDTERKLGETEKKLGDTEKQLTESKTELTRLNEAIDSKAEELETLRQQVEKAEEDSKKQAMECKKLSGQVQVLEDDNNQKDSKIEELEQELDSVDSKLSKIEKERNQLQEEVDDLSNQITKLKKGNNEKSKSIEDGMKEKDALIKELEDRIEEIEQQQKNSVNEDKKSKFALEEEIEKLKEENEELNQKVMDMDDKFSELENKLKKGKNRITELEEQIDELEQDKRRLEKVQKQFDENQKSKAGNEQETKKLKEQLSLLQNSDVEKFIIESAIIYSQPSDYLGSSKVPTPTKVLFLSTLKFSPESSKFFCTNIIKALSYVVDRYARDEEMMMYWVNVLYRLLNLYQSSGNENQVHHSFETMEGVTVQSILAKEEERTLAEPPVYSVLEDDEVYVGDMQEFTDALTDIIARAYLNLCSKIVHLLKDRLVKAVFNPKQASSKSTDGGPDMRLCISLLSEIYQRVEQQKLDRRVVNHIFENVAMCLDSIIFNHFIKDASASKGLSVKMSVAFLENWFNSKNVIQSLRKQFHENEDFDEEKLQVYFTLSRQAADICVIAQKQLLEDEGTRQEICPELSVQQIAYIYSNYETDEYSNTTFSQREIEELIGKKIPTLDNVLSKPLVDFNYFTDLGSKKPTQANIFEFDMLDGHGKINSLEIPKRFFPSKLAEQLNTFLK